jgi:hypothetical protein
VSLLPSAALGAAKITIQNGADVTNQTALYPGVTVKPGAVLGVFTYAEAGRTFPRYSITQVRMSWESLEFFLDSHGLSYHATSFHHLLGHAWVSGKRPDARIAGPPNWASMLGPATMGFVYTC